MDAAVVAVIAVIIGTTAFSWWKQSMFSVLVSIACVVTMLLMYLPDPDNRFAIQFQLAFAPRDLIDPSHMTSVITSMYTHDVRGFTHIFFNLLVLFLIGMPFEERIGTRRFIVVYLLSGLVGTLVFALFRWNDLVIAFGASGSISGVLGAFIRLYPHEKMSLLFIPSLTFPLWLVGLGFLALQVVYAMGSYGIAYEAHLGGMLAGMAIAPILVKTPMHKRVKRMISLSSLRKLAKTPELKAILRRIEDEDLPDVRSAWVEQFISKAKCPHCGSPLKVTKESVMCEKGHLL
ncbi:MAG: rhomboid family intramembrane serine protease [Candidatus Thermoplasmatota archaeon]|nr:rhomboid family intramembrane serine protease [Candidatus Thermoplasmatota archaeon]